MNFAHYRNQIPNKTRSVARSVEPLQVVHRIYFVGLSLLIFALVVTWRLAHLQGAEHKRWLSRASKQQSTSLEIQAARGPVFDSRRRTLAASIEAWNVAIRPAVFARNDERSVETLADILEVSKGKLKEDLVSKDHFFYLRRGVTREVVDRLRRAELVGLELSREFRRVYPQGDLAAQVLGRVSRDGVGQTGIELKFDEALSAGDLAYRVGRDARGRLLHFDEAQGSAGSSGIVGTFGSLLERVSLPAEVFAAIDNQKPDTLRQEGLSLQLTIDAVVQSIMEEEFEAAYKESGAKSVYGIMLNSATGEVLGLAQANRFDPNAISGVSPTDLKNLVVQNTFEPGSTMKPLIAAAALEHGIAHIDEMIDCGEGRLSVGKHLIHDVHGASELTVRDVVVHSSNVGMARLALRMGERILSHTVKDLGFGQTTDVELPGEAKGLVPRRTKWKDIELATMAFGHGIGVTALQMVQAYSALANDGILVKPHIVLPAQGGTITGRRVFQADVARAVAGALRQVVESKEGTGRKAAVEGLRVFGKTGTAHKPKISSRGYDPNRVIASFIGFAELDEQRSEDSLLPRIVLFVVVDEPAVKPRWGGTLAAPVFARIMTRVASYYAGILDSEFVTGSSV